MTTSFTDHRHSAPKLSEVLAAAMPDIEALVPNESVAVLRMLAGVGDHTDDALYARLDEIDRIALLDRISKLALDAAARVVEHASEGEDPSVEGRGT